MARSALDNLQNLKLLEEILRTGQLSAAAEALMTNVSTASRQLGELREALDDPLFRRNGKGLAPTPKMTSLRPIIRSILQNVEALSSEAVFSPSTAVGRFRILSFDNALLFYVFPVLPTLHREAPALSLEFGFVATAEQLVDELRRGEADLALFPVPPSRSDIFTADLEEQHYVLFMRAGHPLASPDAPITAENLQRFTQIGPGVRPKRPWTALRSTGAPFISIPYFNTAPFLIEQTDFVMWMPSRAAELWSTRGRFAVRELPEALSFTFRPKLIWSSRFDADPLHQWVRSLILSGSTPVET